MLLVDNSNDSAFKKIYIFDRFCHKSDIKRHTKDRLNTYDNLKLFKLSRELHFKYRAIEISRQSIITGGGGKQKFPLQQPFTILINNKL